MELKQYQKEALASVGGYFSECLDDGAEKAFETAQPHFIYKTPSESLRDVPYVCVRIPTGGGKTLLAAHSIARIAQNYLSRDYPVTLWLVPSKTIKAQTAEALANPQHPYRVALDKTFNRQVIVVEAENFAQISPQDWAHKAIVVVSTIQNFRVGDKDSRKIYAFNENLAAHFARLPAPVRQELSKITENDLQENGLQTSELGNIKCSFANLLKAYRPLLIVDEAHRAKTALTYDVFEGLSPSAILEFTATPDMDKKLGSNVLYHVGASVLKQEEMIKLPIILTQHDTWEQAVDGAYLRHKELMQKAQSEPDYVRPIVLFQADAKDGVVTVDVLKHYLMENLGIDEREIAVATGKQRELDQINLTAQDCPIQYIITIEALKEGWDCPFAYVFCSVQNVASATDAEQLLGRVLRMPYAKRRQIEDLNRAYAHLSSKKFGETARNLQDKLIGMGFEALEVAEMLRTAHPVSEPNGQGSLFPEDGIQTAPVNTSTEIPPTVFELERRPENLTEQEQRQLTITVQENGTFLVKVDGNMSDNLQESILATATTKDKKEKLAKQIPVHQARVAQSAAPAAKGEQFAPIPKLCATVQGELDLADPEKILGHTGWNLLDFPTALEKFTLRDNARSFEVDINHDKLESRRYQPDGTIIGFHHLHDDWLEHSEENLIRWLDKQVRRPDVAQPVMLVFLQRLLGDLQERLQVSCADLLRQKFVLARDIQDLISSYRQKALTTCYQNSLFGHDDSVQVGLHEQYQFQFDLDSYAPLPPFYAGRYKFSKHYFAQIEDLKESGEEFTCASIIDGLPEVKHWVRNPVKRGFYLPLADRKFYPDFVAELQDGRIMVVEYKGEPYKTNDDSKAKALIGETWARLSDGRCLFIMAVEKDNNGRNVQEQLLNLING